MNYLAMEWALRCQDGSTLDSKHNAPQVGDLVASFGAGDMYPMWIRRIVKVYTHKKVCVLCTGVEIHRNAGIWRDDGRTGTKYPGTLIIIDGTQHKGLYQ